jgi:hypothetical protein
MPSGEDAEALPLTVIRGPTRGLADDDLGAVGGDFVPGAGSVYMGSARMPDGDH